MKTFYGIVTSHPIDEHREPTWFLCEFGMLRAYESQDELLRKAGRQRCVIEFAPRAMISKVSLRPDAIYMIGTWGAVTELERLFPIHTPEIGGFIEVTGPPESRKPVGSAGHGTFYASLESAQKGVTERFGGAVVSFLDQR